MSEAIKDGGPVHPVRLPVPGALHACGDPIPTELHTGISLRDHFAGLAMQADATSQDASEEFSFDERAEWAYQQADAMLRAREKEPSS